MMDPLRMLDADPDGFDAALLRAGRREAPPDGALERAVVALGVGAGATMTGAASAAAAQGSGHTIAKLGLGGIAKWVGIGMTSGLVVTGGAQLVADHTLAASRPVEAVAVPAGRAARPPAMQPTPELPSVVASAPGARPPAGEPRTDAASTIAPRSASAGTPTQRPASPPSLAGELALLGRARAALVEDRPGDALGVVDEYDRAGGAGVLSAEARVLRAEALLRLGRAAEARDVARRALAAVPSGPHAARLRAIAGL